MSAKYAIGLDYGTNSVRALIVDIRNGKEIATSVWTYAHGDQGVVLSKDPNLARQHPADYVKGAETTIKKAISEAKRKLKSFKPEQVIGIGVDATASTPIPVDVSGKPLAFDKRFAKDLDALAWLWKDHTSVDEAEEITTLAQKIHPEYLAKCGGTYSSEWFFSKVLHCKRVNAKVFNAAYTWVEQADWIPAMLTGTEHPDQLTAGVCAAGHKGMYSDTWGGYPDRMFLAKLDPKLGQLRDRLKDQAHTIENSVGGLTKAWAKKTGLPEGTPVAVGAIDAHMGAVGAGIGPGMMVKILGTSSCDMVVASARKKLADIPGICGIVDGSIVPGCFGLEAGQSAVGDIFNWFVNYIQPGGSKAGSHEALSKEAAKLAPGESGLLALDWNNGNRNVLADQRLTGMLVGQTLYTRPAEIYRALIEATAFGALAIINRFEMYGIRVKEVVNCGGIAEKNPMVMQIYADITRRPMKISRSEQTCALGSAIAGAVAAGAKAGGYKSVPEAQKAMTGLKTTVYKPDPKAHAVYKQLFELYMRLHDGFGLPNGAQDLHAVMKQLIDIRNKARK